MIIGITPNTVLTSSIKVYSFNLLARFLRRSGMYNAFAHLITISISLSGKDNLVAYEPNISIWKV